MPENQPAGAIGIGRSPVELECISGILPDVWHQPMTQVATSQFRKLERVITQQIQRDFLLFQRQSWSGLYLTFCIVRDCAVQGMTTENSTFNATARDSAFGRSRSLDS